MSKTDLVGRITYANRVFIRVSGYTEEELQGAPHSVVRHPDMPRCVFKLLWDTLHDGREVFAYVKNMAKNGDHYWVFAHVTPSYGGNRHPIGYHSSRRLPQRAAVTKIESIYRTLLKEEARHPDKTTAMAASGALLSSMLKEAGTPYDEFVHLLGR